MTPLAVGLMTTLGAYLLGSVSFSILLVRALRGVDIRTVGSGNAGATNVLRAAGRGAAAATLLLDVLKGTASVVVARLLDLGTGWVAAAGFAAVLGHCFPIFFRFRGGKGVATAVGALLGLSPPAAGISIAVFAAVLAWKRYVSLASIVATVVSPLALVAIGLRDGGLDGSEQALALGMAAIGGLIVVQHRANIGRLVRGEESRLGRREGRS